MSHDPLSTRAPAKINLTLRVLGRRPDGYHELDSLVAFAGAGAADTLTLRPGSALSLAVDGPTAPAAGAVGDNLVLKAAAKLVERHPGLRAGAFHLVKRLPAAAGIGGGSSDAAAALRLLARLNGIDPAHPVLHEAAAATGADVPVCLDPRARRMEGIGERVGPPLDVQPLFAVLANPRVAVPTPAVFEALGLQPGQAGPGQAGPGQAGSGRDGSPPPLSPGTDPFEAVAAGRNDLEAPAIALAPIIGEALARLRAGPGCRLARMSGSGATVFALYDDRHAASRAARLLRVACPAWWVKATVLR